MLLYEKKKLFHQMHAVNYVYTDTQVIIIFIILGTLKVYPFLAKQIPPPLYHSWFSLLPPLHFKVCMCDSVTSPERTGGGEFRKNNMSCVLCCSCGLYMQ